jgi:hypothetical protein
MCSEGDSSCKFHDRFCGCGLETKSNKLRFQPIHKEEEKERKKTMKDIFHCKCNKKTKTKKH